MSFDFPTTIRFFFNALVYVTNILHEKYFFWFAIYIFVCVGNLLCLLFLMVFLRDKSTALSLSLYITYTCEAMR